jgi:hypothetical protein
MDLLKQFLNDIYRKKFSVRDGKKNYIFTYKIKEHKCYDNLKQFIIEEYVTKGYGIKSLIKDFDLPITYSSLRNLLKFMQINLHEANNANDFLKKRRSNNLKQQQKENRGWNSIERQNENKIKNSVKRGISGYYWNSSKNKYVWLRSSWEFIYAKWLNKNNIEWEIEFQSYVFKTENDNYRYKPDFFIFKEDKLVSIVEIKGYWKNKVYKFNKLKEFLPNIDVVLITDINPYLEQNINKEIELWKQLRKLKLKK